MCLVMVMSQQAPTVVLHWVGEMRQDNQGYPGVVPAIKLNKGCESHMNRLVQGR